MELVSKFRTWGSFIKFSHTIFALPFALSMLIVAYRLDPQSAAAHGGLYLQIFFILLALVSARSAAMTFNRILDRDLDALNPRTENRELPAGKLSAVEAKLGLCIFSVLFFLASAGLGQHCLILAPLVLALLLFYSWTKRFTSYSHLVLGAALALAPGGVWYALTARFAVLPLWMMLGVVLWVAGFDIIYSCQDAEFDVKRGLHSIPAKLGISKALNVARVLHLMAIGALVVFGLEAGLGTPYVIGVALFAALILNQHRLVSASDMSRVNAAFFTTNGLASLVYLAAVVLDTVL